MDDDADGSPEAFHDFMELFGGIADDEEHTNVTDLKASWSSRMSALGEADYAMLESIEGMILLRTLDLNGGFAHEYFSIAGDAMTGTRASTGLDFLDVILGDDSVFGLHASGLGDDLSPDEMLDSSGDDVVHSLRSVTFMKWYPIECPVAVLSGGHGPYHYVARTSVIDGASIVQDVGKAGTIENAVMLLVQQLHSSWRVPGTMSLTIVDPRGNLTPTPGSILD